MEHASGERGIHERCRERTFESRKGILAHARRHHLRTHSPHRGVLRQLRLHRRRHLHRRLHVRHLRALHRGRCSSSRDLAAELGAPPCSGSWWGSITVAAGASMALSLLDSADQTLVATAFALSIASTLALSLCSSTGCAACAGTDEVTAALFVFSALLHQRRHRLPNFRFCPHRAQNIIGMALIVAQFGLPRPAGLRAEHPTERPHRRARTFFHLRTAATSRTPRYLAACAVGMALL